MYVFGDDCTFRTTRRAKEDRRIPDVYVFGVLAIPWTRWLEFQEEALAFKNDEVACPLFPVKWNMKDTGLREHVETHYGEPAFADALRRSDELRAGLLHRLVEIAEPKIVVAGNLSNSTNEEEILRQRNRLTLYSFCHSVERLAIELDKGKYANGTASMVLDWPAKNDRSQFDDGYREAWLRGVIHYKGEDSNMDIAGPLRLRGFGPAPRYAATLLDLGIQMADLVVGLTTRIWKKGYRAEDVKPWMARSFSSLAYGCFRRQGNRWFQRGIVAKTQDTRSGFKKTTRGIFRPYFTGR